MYSAIPACGSVYCAPRWFTLLEERSLRIIVHRQGRVLKRHDGRWTAREESQKESLPLDWLADEQKVHVPPPRPAPLDVQLGKGKNSKAFDLSELLLLVPVYICLDVSPWRGAMYVFEKDEIKTKLTSSI
jgi:hypothetical protein